MEKVKTRKEYFTPAGKALRATSWVVFIIAFVYLVVSHLIWPSLSKKGLFCYLLILAYGIGLLSDVLCLYAGQWSKRTQRRLNITTGVICLPLILMVVSLFKIESASLILPLLIIGNILEYRVAGKMLKEARQSNEQ